MARRSGLGRGLAALIPEQQAPPPAAPATGTPTGMPAGAPDRRIPVTEAPIDRIVLNPSQPRTSMDPVALEELAASIREHGVIQPLLVSQIEVPEREGPSYQLIAGERRLRAAEAAGLTTVPVTVRQTTPQELLELAIIENVQRADLNPLEEALAYQRLIDDFGLTQQEVAERVGKARTSIANTVRLAELPDALRDSLAQGEITEGHARALLGLPSEGARQAAWKEVTRRQLNVRQTELLVRTWLERAEAPANGNAGAENSNGAIDRGPLAVTQGIEAAIQNALGTRVTLKRGREGGGTLTIHFYSDEELEGVMERLVPAEA
jgi:ParB family chromosome partitioning protein